MKKIKKEMVCAVFMVLFVALFAKAQVIEPSRDTIIPVDSLLIDKCPPAFLTYLEKDSLKNKAALFLFNMTLNPLRQIAFRDNKSKYSGLHTKFKMNRCTLIYIESGLHCFHTIYQKPSAPVVFHAGDIYFAEITARTTWPPLFPARKKNSEGGMIEYGPALLYFVTGAEALNRLEKMRNKTILRNR